MTYFANEIPTADIMAAVLVCPFIWWSLKNHYTEQSWLKTNPRLI